MIARRTAALALLATALALGACGDKAQTAAGRKSDAKPWEGGGQASYAAAGWKAGDQAGWEAQLKSRSLGQNEYSRAPAKP